ncbi:glycosyltransferase family 2 protein [Fluviispira multicolorata]|nr:glycosyltransferase family 2 protein [Fluviispira multicolorata]
MDFKTQEKLTLPLVTMGLLTYNHQSSKIIGPELFIEALNSLVNQDYVNKELIIMDDFSTDGTYELCQEYANRYSFVRLYKNDKNLGVMNNLEKLFQKLSGEYFVWVCPDDHYATNYLTLCINQFIKNTNAVLITTAVKVSYDNGDIRHFRYFDFLRNLPFRKMVRNILRCKDSLGKNVEYQQIIHSGMVKANLIPKIYCRVEFYGMEYAWFINAMIWGDIDYIDKVSYFRNDFSISYEIKNPEIYINYSGRFQVLKNNFKYLNHFLFQTNFPLRKKLMYFWVSLHFLRYYIFPRLIADSKVVILIFIRKIGLMRYNASRK